jgi:hypothetical protein
VTSRRDLTTDLRALPFPAPPQDLTGVVMARIEQLPNPVGVPHRARKRPLSFEMIPAAWRSDWSVWISLAGLGAGLVIAMLNFPAPAPLTSLGRGGALAGLADVSTAPIATLALVTGFAIYLASLFLPVRERP